MTPFYAVRGMYCIELKSTAGKAVSFAGSNPMIKSEQVTALRKAHGTGGAVAGFLLNYRTVDKTFWMPIGTLEAFMAVTSRMSIGIRDAERCGVRIPQKRLRVHYRYDLSVIWENAYD